MPTTSNAAAPPGLGKVKRFTVPAVRSVPAKIDLSRLATASRCSQGRMRSSSAGETRTAVPVMRRSSWRRSAP